MQTMICEVCGSSALSKENGHYICRYCKTKYTIEEARSLLHSDPKEDPSDSGELRALARQAVAAGQGQRAKRYYELTLQKNPELWDALFYSFYFKAMTCPPTEVEEIADQLDDIQTAVLQLIQAHVAEPKAEQEALEELTHRMIEVSDHLFLVSKKAHYDQVTRNKIFEKAKYAREGALCRDVLYHYGDLLVMLYKNCYGRLAAMSWEAAARQHEKLHPVLHDLQGSRQTLLAYGRKIRKYNPHYIAPKLKSGGCYVATAVYGSYDCPQVWTLRRYRDDRLAKTAFGRLFIRIYYGLSPTLVRLFGAQSWFHRLLKPRLDRLVSRLQKEGVADTPYEDQ